MDPCPLYRRTRRRASLAGFTLIEMAVVLVVIGLIILTVFPALQAARTSSQRSMTQTNLQSLMLATAAFAQANGCLPCPTPAATVGAGFGRVRGDTVADACKGCAAAEGIPPFVSLGLPMAAARDGWGRWITMRVDPDLTAETLHAVVPPTKPVACACAAPTGGVCAASPAGSGCACAPPVGGVCAPLPNGVSQQGLCAGDTSFPSANRIKVSVPGGAAQDVAVIFVSHGADGYGAYVANATTALGGLANGARLSFPAALPACSPGTGFSRCNADNNAQFTDAPLSTGSADPYDDMMIHAGRNALVAMLGGGSACQSSSW